ncbi:MAG: hypothetical protein ACOYN5_08405 [Bacteroidales bacterium]
MKNLIKFLVFILLFGCGVILINENNYRNLSDTDKIIIMPFDPEIVSKNENNKQFQLYEINANDIMNYTKMHNYTWVHLWRPFCPNQNCQNIYYFLDVVDSINIYDIEFLLVSESYDLKLIENIVINSAYDKPIFVLQDSHYGHKINSNRLKFIKDFETELSYSSHYGFGDFLFKDSTLIYMGDDLNKDKIESLFDSFQTKLPDKQTLMK